MATLIDTVSKFSPGMKENDNAEVSAFLANVCDGIRDRLHCTALGVAHTGHVEQGRPRGAYAFMANPDAEYVVTRPDMAAMIVTVTRERFKDTAALPSLAYTARVVDLGRLDAHGDAVTSLVLDGADLPPSSRAKKGLGKNQERALVALREWIRANPDNTHLPTMDLQAILTAQGMKDRQRRYEAISFLANLGVLIPAVGGPSVHAEALT